MILLDTILFITITTLYALSSEYVCILYVEMLPLFHHICANNYTAIPQS